MEILKGHISPETAYLVDDYPYGFRLRDTYREGVPEAGRPIVDQWVAAKLAYDRARQPGDPLEVGLVEAHNFTASSTEFTPSE